MSRAWKNPASSDRASAVNAPGVIVWRRVITRVWQSVAGGFDGATLYDLALALGAHVTNLGSARCVLDFGGQTEEQFTEALTAAARLHGVNRSYHSCSGNCQCSEIQLRGGDSLLLPHRDDCSCQAPGRAS